jgi:hypothetical protein
LPGVCTTGADVALVVNAEEALIGELEDFNLNAIRGLLGI